MPKINHKILFLTSSLTFLLTLPVMANLGDVWTNFQYYGTNLQNINIQNEQSKIIGETLGNTIQIHESLQYSNLNLANISEQMDEVNRARRVDTSAEVARLLRVTSQTDLLGRKN